MKKLLLLLVLVPFTIKAQINDYFQYNPQWTVLRIFGASYPCIEYDSTNYFLNGDSSINSMVYKKLFKRGHVIDSWQSPNPNTSCYGNYTYQDTAPTGYLRSQGLQMYYIPHGDTSEVLLYDFNLTVGSPLPITYTNCCPGYTVTAIDSFFTPYGYLKRYYLNNSSSEMLIEGVGSNYGLIEPLGTQLSVTFQNLCYSENDTAYWPMMGPACDVITFAGNHVNPDPAVNVFPNPASEKITVTSDLQSGWMEIIDVNGKLVYCTNFSLRAEIELSAFEPGMYFIRISGENFYSTKIFVRE